MQRRKKIAKLLLKSKLKHNLISFYHENCITIPIKILKSCGIVKITVFSFNHNQTKQTKKQGKKKQQSMQVIASYT